MAKLLLTVTLEVFFLGRKSAFSLDSQLAFVPKTINLSVPVS